MFARREEVHRWVACATVALLLMMGARRSRPEGDVRRHVDVGRHSRLSTGSAVIGKLPAERPSEVRRELGSWVAVAWPEGDAGMGYLHMTWGTMSDGSAAETSPGFKCDFVARAFDLTVRGIP